MMVVLLPAGSSGCAVEALTQMDITICVWQKTEKLQAESQRGVPMDVDDGGDDGGGYHKKQVSPTCDDVIIALFRTIITILMESTCGALL